MTHVNHAWLPTLTDLCERGMACVLITVMEAKGSTPREAGTKMVVTADEQFGTIGGGNLEFQAIDRARELLTGLSDKSETRDYALGPQLAQCCGGAVSVLLEPFIKNDKEVILFGAGHVGKEIVQVLEGLAVTVKWVDEREDEFPDTIPANTTKIIAATPTDALSDINDNSFILILTHSHALDYDLTKAALQNGEASYVGLIGSKTKRVKFIKQLQEDGVDEDAIARLTCPIGIDGITGKHPREIAVSVTAELLGLGLTRQS